VKHNLAQPAADAGADLLQPLLVLRWRNGQLSESQDVVAVEVPVALEYNGISHVVMLASPGALEDFALGFSLSEGLLTSASQLYDCEVVTQAQGLLIRMQIASERFALFKEQRRNMTGRTGCGLCGAETLEQVYRHPAVITHRHTVPAQQLFAGMQAMQALQPLQQQSGATHAAAWMNVEGEVVCVREDVGRHNALDKLIGALAYANTDFSQGAVLITSRASVEMVQKAAMMGIATVAAISAPTSLAVQLAKDSGVSLVGFMREQSYVVYAHPERIQQAT
jgi:FdhD protein